MRKKINDVTKFATLIPQPPVLPATAFKAMVVEALKKKNFIAAANALETELDPVTVEVYGHRLRSLDLPDEVLYSLVSLEGEDVVANEEWMATPTSGAGVNHYCCDYYDLIGARTGCWRKRK